MTDKSTELPCHNEIALLVHWWGEQFQATHGRGAAKKRKAFEAALAAALHERLKTNPATPVEVVAQRTPGRVFVSQVVIQALAAAGAASEQPPFLHFTGSRFRPGEVLVSAHNSKRSAYHPITWLLGGEKEKEKSHVSVA